MSAHFGGEAARALPPVTLNAAVAEDQMSLVHPLNEEYIEEALRLILATA